MANDLKILITAGLNSGKSIGEINTAIGGIEKKINSLKLNIEVNDKILGTLKNFTEQMKRISDAALNTGKVIEEALMPDGTKIKRTYFDGLKGEFSETIKAAKESSKSQLASLDEVAAGYDKVIKQVEKYNAAQKKVGETLTVSDKNGVNSRTINSNAQGQVTSYKDTTNQQKQDKLDEQAIKDQQKLIEQMEQFRLQSLQRVQQQELQWNTAQQQSIQRNMDLTRQEIAQQQQLEAEIKRRLELYQREAQINATNINGRYGEHVNQTALGNQLSTVLNASPNQFKNLQQLRNFITESNVGFRELTAGIDNMHQHTLTLGSALQQAFQKFPVWLIASTALFQSFNFLKDGIFYVNELNNH
jgi:hypothetical protein